MIYFFPSVLVSTFTELAGFNYGAGNLLTQTEVPAVGRGWNVAFYLGAFPHEIGHMLGGHHEPETFSNLAEARAYLVRPYAFGHTDLTSCAKRERCGDILVCPRTVMSYGAVLSGDPTRTSVWEPFYSSVRHKPSGWTIGVAGERENERVFAETLPFMARAGETPYKDEQYPRRIDARWTERDTARVTWSEKLQSFEVALALAGGGNDKLQWSDAGDAENPSWIQPISDANGSHVGVDIAGLRPGGQYRISVEGPPRRDPGTHTLADSLHSDVFSLPPPRVSTSAPEAPDDVAVSVVGANGARLTWSDNSRNENGFEVWFR